MATGHYYTTPLLHDYHYDHYDDYDNYDLPSIRGSARSGSSQVVTETRRMPNHGLPRLLPVILT